MILSKNNTDVFIDTKNYSHGDSPMNSTITFSTTTSNTTAAARRHRLNAKGETTAHAAEHNHRRNGPTRSRSLNFGKCNGYLKGPARFHSLDFGERNGYLKGVTPIDAQQKSMELLTFSCSRGSSWVGRYYRGMAATVGRNLIKLYELADLSSCRRGTLHRHDPEQLPLRQKLAR